MSESHVSDTDLAQTQNAQDGLNFHQQKPDVRPSSRKNGPKWHDVCPTLLDIVSDRDYAGSIRQMLTDIAPF